MKLNISVNTNKHCKIIIEDKSKYLNESFTGISKGEFKYSDTTSVIILQHNKLQQDVIAKVIYNDHSSNIKVPIEFDGWFTVNYIVLPNRDWFERELNKTSGSALGLYDIVYFTDNDNIYKYINGKIENVDVKEVIEINPLNTTISITNKDYISICFLQHCYINLCQQIFESRGFSQCWNKNNIDSELIYKRDLTWMLINVIRYLVECNQLSEVQRLIEISQSCNGLCVNNIKISNNCGCK